MNEYDFEWDEEKARANERKHGISFSDACRIWNDPLFVEAHLTSTPEHRWIAVGRIGKGNYLTAIFTYREDSVRLISARKSTKKEVDLYESH